MTEPNILYLMTDQQRWDAMGCSGGWVDTPNMDRIASEGVRFSNCVTTSPVCISARVSMATGLYPHHTGIRHNMEHTLPPETPTWMQAVRSAGYRTSLFGKTHLHPHRGDLREREYLLNAYGLDDVNEIGGPRASARVLSHMTADWDEAGIWEAYQEDFKERFSKKPNMVRPSTHPLEWYADVYVGRHAKNYLRDYRRDEPWFCWVSFGGPHEPWDTPEPYASQYASERMPAPATRPKSLGPHPTNTLDSRYEEAPILEPGDTGAMRADYAGNVSLIDAQIGELLDTIEERGELGSTVIILTSDHGEHNGDAGLIYKETFLDGAVRVPMLVRTPDTCNSHAGGQVNDSFVEWFDAGPTLVELAGGELTHEQSAKSLLPSLSNSSLVHREEAISEYRQETMIMNDKWKMAVNEYMEPYLLIDREQDPGETRNLAGVPDTETVVEELVGRIKERVKFTR